MKSRSRFSLDFLLLPVLLAVLHLAASPLIAGVTGTVREVSGGVAVVEAVGGAPAAGDTAQFFFKMPGADDEISVAEGIVLGTEGSATKVKIGNATGDVSKDQLVRFNSADGSVATPVSPVASATPSTSSAAGYIGCTLGMLPGGSDVSVMEVFPDGPAVRAGIQVNDKIVAVDDLPVTGGAKLFERLKAFAPGTIHDFLISRNNIEQKLKLTVGTRPADFLSPEVITLVNDGVSQLSAGNAAEAIRSFTAALEISPAIPNAYLNRANAHISLKNFQAAIEDATKALELQVAKADDAYVIRGIAKNNLRDFDGAISDCTRALEINPKSALAYNNRANNKIFQGNNQAALADLDAALQLDPNLGLTFYNYGYAYGNLGKLPQALRDWKKAIALQPSLAAELSPKIAQLEKSGIKQEGVTTKKASSPEENWVDLTNAQKKIVGTWQGGRHRTQYFADGTFVTDPHLVPDPPRARWEVQGDRLVEYVTPANVTITHQIIGLDGKNLVIRNAKGEIFRLKKLK